MIVHGVKWLKVRNVEADGHHQPCSTFGAPPSMIQLID